MIPGHLLRIGNQGDYDVMWGEFPGSMDVPRCMNHVKILYRFTYASAVGGDVLGRYKFGTWITTVGGGFPIFFDFYLYTWGDDPNWLHNMGWNHQLDQHLPHFWRG